uniref:Retrotransposon protein n=2 Tax=Cucumis melo TaxID=3656 RepID=A0A9I9DCP9_CUCME|nr:hypothetical protein [Cucumis melo subsp. melo]
MASSSRDLKHLWIKEKDATLVECLVKLVNSSGWWSDNGTFGLGYYSQLTRMMAQKMSGPNIQATTIDSCIKTMEKTFHAISEIRGPSCSGFSWNDELNYIIVEKDVFDNWMKGLNMSPDEFMDSRLGRSGDGRNASSRSKRKRCGRLIEIANIIQNAMEYANDQLNRIVDWPILRNQDASVTQQEVVRQLQAIHELNY